MSSPKRTCAIYVRVSSVRGREGDNFHSPEVQEARIRGDIESRGWDAGPVFTDLDVSGRSMSRPEFERARAWLSEDPRNRAIGVYDTSRWGRVVDKMLTALKEVYKEGGVVIGLPANYGTDMGKTMVGMDALFAEQYSMMIGRNWRATHKRRIAAGKPTGGPPRFGYYAVEGEKYHQPHPVNGPVLAQMYRDYIAGKGAQALTKDLNDRGIPSPRGNTWTHTSVLRALDSGFGAGLLRLAKGAEIKDEAGEVIKIRERDEFVKGGHRAVITEAEWALYQAERNRKRTLPPKHKAPKWWLAGIAHCGLCGERLIVNSYSAVKSQAICGAYKSRRTCNGVWIGREYLESVVGLWLAGRVEELATGAAGRIVDQAERVRTAEASMKAREAEVKALVAKQARLVLLDLDAAVVTEATSQLNADLATARAAHDEAVIAHAEASNEPGQELLDRYEAGVEGMDPSQWNTLVAKVIKFVVVTKESITITSRESTAEPAVYERRRQPRHRDDMARGGDGKFVGKVKS